MAQLDYGVIADDNGFNSPQFVKFAQMSLGNPPPSPADGIEEERMVRRLVYEFERGIQAMLAGEPCKNVSTGADDRIINYESANGTVYERFEDVPGPSVFVNLESGPPRKPYTTIFPIPYTII